MPGTRKPIRPRWGCLIPLVVVVVVGAAFAVYLLVQRDAERDHPPAAAPDLCVVLGDLPVRLVPHDEVEAEATYTSGPDASCVHSTADGRPAGSEDYGFLRARLLRYGQIGFTSGPDRAGETFVSECAAGFTAGPSSGLPGLGDEACAAYSDEGEGGTAHGSVVARRGADLFWVDYYVHPGAAEQAGEAVAETARTLLAGVI
ncbi:hypothetical protein [Phytomonospora endophytica]|uniref:DUF3558 domain-containing protein n=1 Tax=Phytomonospora endophytica TaxID=714109 RepID=A0A841FB94_9ACTN|nr:hypothetical protein [Phytomonospora endophytica]MBB6034541.1 hypothetical protein [Phytomonospora endophytica]GIG70449.1 hypothetical protein Pen01_67440 [Phytomonospora endophytica]